MQYPEPVVPGDRAARSREFVGLINDNRSICRDEHPIPAIIILGKLLVCPAFPVS